MIEGPMPILNALCRLSGIHSIPVGDDTTFEKSDEISSNIRLYFSSKYEHFICFLINFILLIIADHSFSKKKSKYSDSVSTSSNFITGTNMLNITIDQQKLNEMRNE